MTDNTSLRTGETQQNPICIISKVGMGENNPVQSFFRFVGDNLDIIIALGFPIVLLLADQFLKESAGGDHRYAGADASLCAAGILITFFLAGLYRDAFASGKDATTVGIMTGLATIVWPVSVTLASKRGVRGVLSYPLGVSMLVLAVFVMLTYTEAT